TIFGSIGATERTGATTSQMIDVQHQSDEYGIILCLINGSNSYTTLSQSTCRAAVINETHRCMRVEIRPFPLPGWIATMKFLRSWTSSEMSTPIVRLRNWHFHGTPQLQENRVLSQNKNIHSRKGHSTQNYSLPLFEMVSSTVYSQTSDPRSEERRVGREC